MDTSEHEILVGLTDATTRRALLRTSLGGFALAASGLFLLAGREKAGAREGAYGGVLGGRHGEDRRGRDKRKHDKRRADRRRRHRDRHRPDSGGWRNVNLYIHNRRSAAVAVRQWQMIGVDDAIKWGLVTDWLTIEGTSASGPEHFHDFVTDIKRFAVEINTGHVIDVANPLLQIEPSLLLGVGGWTNLGWSPVGATLINKEFVEWETAKSPGFEVQRLNDTPTHKQFQVNLV